MFINENETIMHVRVGKTLGYYFCNNNTSQVSQIFNQQNIE